MKQRTKKTVPGDVNCYACSEPGTTWEHAPCSSFFPLPTTKWSRRKFRESLLRVPSCSEHNAAKSDADNYASSWIPILAAQVVADRTHSVRMFQHPFIARKIKAVNHGHRLRVPLDAARPTWVVDPTGLPSMWMSFDRKTLDHWLRSLARALYYHTAQWERRWEPELRVEIPFFRHSDLSPGVDLSTVSHLMDLRAAPKGTHPGVFTYQFFNGVMKLVFYDVFECFVFPTELLEKFQSATQGSEYNMGV